MGTLGGSSTDSSAINDQGVVVGISQTADNEWHAFVFRDGVMTDLGPGTYGNDVNNRNQILVNRPGAPSVLITGTETLVLQHPGLEDRTLLLSDTGQVLSTGGFLWHEGEVFDLREQVDNETPYTNHYLFLDINNVGEILAGACTDEPPYGTDCAILKLVPIVAIPEPSSWAMLIAGLGLIGWKSRRKPFRKGTVEALVPALPGAG